MADQNPQDVSKALQDLLGISALSAQLTESLEHAFSSDEFTKALSSVVTSDEVRDLLKTAVGSGLRSVTADEDYLKLVVATISDSVSESILQMAKKAAADGEARQSFNSAVTAVCNNTSMKGLVADGVYSGFKRLLEDGDVQKNIAQVGSLVLGTQQIKVMLTQIAEVAAQKQREFFKSAEFKAVLTEIGDGSVASLKEVLNLSVSEAVENLKKVKVTLSGSLGGGDAI
jgi:hypothetical protein